MYNIKLIWEFLLEIYMRRMYQLIVLVSRLCTFLGINKG